MTEPLPPELNQRFETLVKSAPVLLFMKGNRTQPQCGFSAQVVQILDRVLEEYQTIDVLQDQEIREGIKEFSDWPTIPQLYVEGEFQGGCDIVGEMYANGELHRALGQDPPKVEDVAIDLSDDAAAMLEQAKAQYGGGDVHLGIDARFQHSLAFGPPSHDSVTIEANGIKVLMDPDSAARADGLKIDVQQGPRGQGLSLDNPNAPQEPDAVPSAAGNSATDETSVVDGITQMSVEQLDQLRKSGRPYALVDVRTKSEREIATIDDALWLEQDLDALLTLDKGELLVFYCHTGRRSQKVASEFAGRGFTNACNLAGGIDAWSQKVDSDVARYS